ncbi:MAG TPA: ABC transporter permease, partial [Candidatus Saccharimonadales bacterium]|nr:ABC transporter permease [Candidatus Saccharimonadales bacterium]
VDRPLPAEKFSTLNLSTEADRVYYSAASLHEKRTALLDRPESHERVMVPNVAIASHGFRTTVEKLIAALGIEFQLLRAERSLIVLAPVAIFFSTLELAFYKVVPEVSYSATYVTSTTGTLILFLLGLTVFYTGEAMHRDRESKIEPGLWSTPIPNRVLLLSKFLATLVLGLSLVVVVGVIAVVIQILKGDTPVNISAYLITYSVILLPNIVFMSAVSVALNVLLRDKYVAYAVSAGIAGGLFYLYGEGYNHWLYNPLLYQLWNYADLVGDGNKLGTILSHRLYCVAIAAACLSLAHLFFERKEEYRS